MSAATSTEVENSSSSRSIEVSTSHHNNTDKIDNNKDEDDNSNKEQKQKSTDPSTASTVSHSDTRHTGNNSSSNSLYTISQQTDNNVCKSEVVKHDSSDELDEMNKTSTKNSNPEPPKVTTGKERSN